MRANSVEIEWFRGSAQSSSLSLVGKSVVIFGPNGSGKSSFVDAVEVNITGGKVGHLSHEYSGRFQEKGLINTARPKGATSSARLVFANGLSSNILWTTGAPQRAPASLDLAAWDTKRTVLRQEELSEFIKSTKGDKYSAILPLLGLDGLEAAAINLHQLARTLERKGNLQAKQAVLTSTQREREETFGSIGDAEISEQLQKLSEKYLRQQPQEPNKVDVPAIISAIETQISTLDRDNRRAAALGEIAASNAINILNELEKVKEVISEQTEPLIKERLKVVAAASDFIGALGNDTETALCPACGSEVRLSDFGQHLIREQEVLSKISEAYGLQEDILTKLYDELRRLQGIAAKPELTEWREAIDRSTGGAASYLADLSTSSRTRDVGSFNPTELRARLEAIVNNAIKDAKLAPEGVQALLHDLKVCKTTLLLQEGKITTLQVKAVFSLIKLLQELEAEIREEISNRARATFSSISLDIQRFWAVLRPLDAITDTHLSVPTGTDRAIEVCLTFHGREQDSPRLTLSEGQRNALGLCIFLAMANKARETDRPIFLDDVVISFDREHRNRVAALLEQEFQDRQVVLFTHDREWFVELQRTLRSGHWAYQRLLPFESPSTGIKFAGNSIDLETARSRAKTEPLEAMQGARRVMDVVLGEIAEQISLPMAYLRGNDNDTRTAGQFLVALERQAANCFKIRVGENHVSNEAALEAIRRVKPDLSVWANRATHTFSGTATEAEDLIVACEALLAAFNCASCGTHVGAFEGTGGKKECRCGALRWQPR